MQPQYPSPPAEAPSIQKLSIDTYMPEWREAVVELVLGIQRGEFGIPITAEQQPDLLDIPAFYRRERGEFWCARLGGRVVGTIGLLNPAPDLGVIRKMFVDPEYRGREWGTAQALLDTAISHARNNGLREIVLGTIDKYHAAIRFYARNRFEPVSESDLPQAFPRMSVDNLFFRLPLNTDEKVNDSAV